MKPGTRVFKVDSVGSPTKEMGLVVECLNNSPVSRVKWDDGNVSIWHDSFLIPHQELKRMFKYGPKLRKRP